MSARRCTGCDIHWPSNSTYKTCPGCGQRTWTVPCAPLTADSAKKLAADLTLARQRREQFEQYYADREAERAMATFDMEAAALLEA